MKFNYKHTLIACFFGYITQAVVNNFAPLLFLIFHENLGISLSHITLLVTINFLVQLFVDAVSPMFIDRIGYKKSIVIAHAFAALGLLSLGILPNFSTNSYAVIVFSVVLYAIGGGIIEVLISPIAESCPTENKASVMSLLHSFYCWGTMAVVIVSTLFLHFAGKAFWPVLSCFWALIPILNGLFFMFVPVNQLTDEKGKMSLKSLFSSKTFFVFVLLMVSAGASEQAMSQWASYFTESTLGISKALGDILGICMFALMMGIARVLYSVFSHKLKIKKALVLSGLLNLLSYVVIAFSPYAPLTLLFCALCGFSSGILWPGVFSMAAEYFPKGGTALFAFLALAGDAGCSSGPTLTGFVSALFNSNIHAGLLAATVFPLILILSALSVKKKCP